MTEEIANLLSNGELQKRLMMDLRKNVPAHLFNRSTKKSLAYLVHDLILCAILFFLSTFIKYVSSFWIRSLLWMSYGITQGIVMTGLWVIAHECGHMAFSNSKTLNDVVGFILHSALAVPYFSWKYTHSMHHKSTNCLDRDTVFIPKITKIKHAFKESAPIYDTFRIFRMLLCGWPGYLLLNLTGQKYNEWASHFKHTSPMFEKTQRKTVFVSSIGVYVTLFVVGLLIYHLGFLKVMLLCIVPYLFVNMWLVLITFLQHTHPKIPYYTSDNFSFINGALSTVDRDYGILNHFFHHIGDSHVAHHLFSTMPHYNAVLATPFVRKTLESAKLYMYDSTPIVMALWQSYRKCNEVTPMENGIYMYLK